ncbi:MAG TPA: FAD-dependent oxidoreductase [Bryobacteraceae bacterium]|nr:FAD-dependent oxidoreductase [Bryobacteraceae bacterium]
MNRRNFLAGAGMGGYSLIVRAAAPSVAQNDNPHAFERIAPPENLRHVSGVERHMTLVELDTDVLVAGGGMAGVCAAVAAARHGAKVVLVQDRSRLGGNSSSEVKMHIVGASCHKGRPGWRESGLLEEFRLDDAVNNPQRCWELWDLLLYDKVMSEPNITLLLESSLYSAAVRDGKIQEVMVRCDKSEHLYRIRAGLFVDATGDSRLGLEAGAEMRVGREARGEFGESLAPEKADRETLGSSILFTSRLHHRPMPFKPPKWARRITKEQLVHRNISSWEYGYWWIEWGGNLDTIRDNERIRFELLSIVMGVWDYIKNSGEFPDSSNFALDWVGMMPGRRGSRRLVGDHILTQHDLTSGQFEDAVAIGGWPLDDHPPGGFDRADLPPNTVLHTDEVYNIPLRSLYSRNVRNLFMAGRNISATHAAFTSTRVMGTCSVIGQAVGTAAALCRRRNLAPRELYEQKDQLRELQQALLRDDQTIRGLANRDAADLGRQARVTASGEHGDARAALVFNGFTRDIPGGQVNHWAAPMGDGGAWIELAWERPQTIREIQITFDSGFQRELTLTSQDSINTGIVRAAQPETVRDYAILCRAPEADEPAQLVSVKGNHQRVKRHRFERPVAAQALRLQVSATNGDEFARVFEIRCYA